MDDEEFNLLVLPSNQFDQFPINASEEFIVGIHADVTLLTPSDEEECDGDEDAPDFECTTQERFLYDNELKLGRTNLLQNEKVCRAALVNALTGMEALPEKYYDEIVDGVFTFVNENPRFEQCCGVSVDIELVKYAEYYDDDDDDETEVEEDRIEPCFATVLVDETMRESLKCMICLDGFEVGVGVCKLKCQHVFHRKCLLNWFDRSVSCPLCRTQPPSFFVSPSCASRPT